MSKTAIVTIAGLMATVATLTTALLIILTDPPDKNGETSITFPLTAEQRAEQEETARRMQEETQLIWLAALSVAIELGESDGKIMQDFGWTPEKLAAMKDELKQRKDDPELRQFFDQLNVQPDPGTSDAGQAAQKKRGE